MKKVMLSAALLAALVFTACKTEKKEDKVANETEQASRQVALADVSFGVRGNCNMCKKTIETAALNVDGVEKAVWDVNLKKIDVSFDESRTDLDAIHTAIAGSGYDTEKTSASEEAYKELPACCQYDHSMEMNRDTPAEDGHSH